MKDLTKKISAVLVILMMLVTGFTTSVAAEPNPTTDTATVTVSGLEPGASVTLYKIVQPKSGTSFTGYEFVSQARDELVGPNDLIEVKDSSNNKLFVAAKDLDVDNDGLIDTKYNKDSTEYTVDETKAGKILYDMENPNQVSINRAVAANAYESTLYTDTVAPDKDYVQFDVLPGQYIGIITPGPGDNYSYSPVVLSAGYSDVQKYKLSSTPPGDYYKYKNGDFTNVNPAKETYHLYDNCAWDETNGAVFAQDDSATGVNANVSYKKLYLKDGETTETQLLASDLKFPANYEPYPSGTTAVPKRSKPGIVKNHEMDIENKETSSAENTIKVPVIATDDKNCEIVDENDKLKYIKAIYTIDEFEDAKAGKKFIFENEKYAQDDAGTFSGQTVLEAMMTTEAKEALTVTRADGRYEFMASQGEEIRYTLAPSVPQYPLNAKNKTFVVTDNLSAGLDFVEGSIEIGFASSVSSIEDNTATGSPNYSFTTTPTSHHVERVQDTTDGSLYHFFVYENVGKFKDVTTDAEKYYKEGDEYILIDANTTGLTDTTDVYTRKEFAKAKEIAAGTQGNDNDFQVNFIYDNLPGGEGAKVAPVIRYKAVLLDTAIEGVEGNPNVAKVYYAKNTSEDKNWNTDNFQEPSGADYNEWRDARKVYTYEIRFRKTNDKPEYITTDEDPTHYVLKDYAGLSAEQKAKVDALVKADGTGLFETTGTGTNQQYIAKTQAIVKLADGNEVMRYITTVAPVTETTAANADVYESTSKTIKLNPDFKSLSGAIFGLYTDAECENLVSEIKVGDDGVGFSTKVGNRSYWLKEIVPPQHYSKNSEPIQVTPTWTSATTYTTEDTDRKVYTADITKAMDANANGKKPAVKTQETNNVVADASIDQTTELAEDQVGWFVGTPDSKFYENAVYDLSDNGKWDYNEADHEMRHEDGTVIKYVFRAYLEKHTTTSDSGSATVYNNNGGTVSLNRINNTKTSELPSTGGVGTYLFTIAGVAIIATAAFMLIFRNKEEHNH